MSTSSKASNGGNSKVDDFDFDVFLTNVESKLRGPFSSLDLAKSVTTSALRGSLTPPQYLENLNKVLLRTDKVSQLRILIGLLGLEPERRVDAQIYNILQTAQQNGEEWIIAIAGFIQGILFKDQEDSRESCRGEAAQELLTKTCQDICKRVQDEITTSCPTPDLNAHFVPFRYSLIGRELMKKAKIGTSSLLGGDDKQNPHFKVNEDADILKIDEKLEAQRAKEARELAPIHLRSKPKGPTTNASGSSLASGNKRNLPPGFRPTNLVQRTKAKASSSMFVTRPNPAAQKAQLANRTKLLRRKGGAQSLVNASSAKSKQAKAMAMARTSTTAGRGGTALGMGARGAAASGGSSSTFSSKGRFSSGRSKVKMMDMEDVSNLQAKMRREQEEAASSKSSKKRSAATAAGSGVGVVGAQVAQKKAKVETKEKTSQELPTSSMDQDKDKSGTASQEDKSSSFTPTTATAAATFAAHEEQEWKILMRERSNKLSDQDRVRVSQFFENNYYNPTPDQSMYKMKIHEQRMTDPSTGKNIKETYYLELDYEKQDYRQSKKVKRY